MSFAIIQTGGKQYKVKASEILKIEQINFYPNKKNPKYILIDKKIKEGKTEKEIYDFLTEKYGEWILYDPKLNKNTYILWFLPLLIFLIWGGIVFKKIII